MPKLTPVDYDPFKEGQKSPSLTPVEHDPFAPSLGLGEVATGAVRNFPPDLWKLGKETISAFVPESFGGAGPINTAKAIGEMALGGAEKLIPGQQSSEPSFDALTEHFKNQYGTVEGIKNAVATQPAHVLADLSTVLSGGGAIISKIPGLAKIGRLASTSGRITEPLNVTKTVLTAPVTVIRKALPESYVRGLATSWYAKPFKPSTTLRPEIRDRIITTALENRIELKRAGFEKSRGLVDALNNEIADRINMHAAVQIQREEVLGPLKALRGKYMSTFNRTGLPEDLKAVSDADRVIDGFRNPSMKEARSVQGGSIQSANPVIFSEANKTAQNLSRLGIDAYDTGREVSPPPFIKTGGNINSNADLITFGVSSKGHTMSLQDVQIAKQALNKKLNDFYRKVAKGQNMKPDEWAQNRAALADGMRQEITTILPELKNLNQREGSLIELNRELSRTINRISNHNLASLTKGIYTAAGGEVAGVSGAITGGILSHILNNPAVSSKLAIALYHGKSAAFIRQGGAITTPLRQGAYQVGQAVNTNVPPDTAFMPPQGSLNNP